MIINVPLKSQLSSLIARSVDSVFCMENGVTYRVSPIDNHPIVDNNLPVITSVQTTAPTTTSYSEVGTVRVNSTTNDVYICTNNSDSQNVIWKNTTQELNHTNFTNKDDNYDGGHTYLVPRLVKTINPTLTDSSYKVGTIWVNTSSDTIFICTDNATDNAIWNEYNKKYQVISDTIDMFEYVRYNYSDIVTYNNKTYFCITEYVTSDITPLVDTTKWKDVTTGFTTWSVSTSYVLHDIVKFQNEKYICIENRTATQNAMLIYNTPSPPTDNTHWLKIDYETEWIPRLPTCYVQKTVLSSSINSNTIFTFQFNGSDIQSYIISGITLNVISIIDNTSFVVCVFAPDGYYGEVAFKVIMN